MSVEVQWTESDAETGERRIVRATRFAGNWRFQYRLHRRDDWSELDAPTADDWAELLDSLERRYTRREGVSEADLAAVRKVIAGLRPAPGFDGVEL